MISQIGWEWDGVLPQSHPHVHRITLPPIQTETQPPQPPRGNLILELIEFTMRYCHTVATSMRKK